MSSANRGAAATAASAASVHVRAWASSSGSRTPSRVTARNPSRFAPSISTVYGASIHARALAADGDPAVDVELLVASPRTGRARRRDSPRAWDARARRTCATPATGRSGAAPSCGERTVKPLASRLAQMHRPESPGSSASPPHSSILPACAATAVGRPRSIGSAMNSPMSSARPVSTPSSGPARRVAERGHDRLGADQGDHPVGRVDVLDGEPRRQAGVGAARQRPAHRRSPRPGASSLPSSERITPTRGCQPVALAHGVEPAQAGLEVDVGAGDAEGEDEGHAVPERRAHVGLDVGGLVGRDLLAGAEPVGTPVAAGPLRDDRRRRPTRTPARSLPRCRARARCG